MVELIKNYKGKTIAVIGDVMLDHFLIGTVERISQEAPVPVVQITEETRVPGGAANVAVNIKDLGGTPILVSVVGRDEEGKQLSRLLRAKNISASHLITDTKRVTTTKTRLVALHQQIARIDREQTDFVSAQTEAKLIAQVKKILPKTDALIISDYAKGVMTSTLARFLLQQNIPVIVDAKPRYFFQYKKATIITPNHHEATKITSTPDVKKAARLIARKLSCSVLVTQGADGMTLFHDNRFAHLTATAHEVVDTVGAGDTVVAALALGIAAGADLLTAATIANKAAGIVVQKTGTASVTYEELHQ